MRSSDGHHWIALDHIRAVAALMVLSWHFVHGSSGFPVPFHNPPAFFPLAIFDEGHTGVSLFMALSGYLFAKLLDGKSVNYVAFYWNRFLRLAPLLLVALALAGLDHAIRGDLSLAAYSKSLLEGIVKPTLPNGAWSITVEVHFYLLLPFILAASRRWAEAPIALLVALIAVRICFFTYLGGIQELAYFTLVGRTDQFVLGILAFQHRGWFRDRHVEISGLALAFGAFYYWFDQTGGFYKLGGAYPSPSPLWIVLPTIEGLVYAAMIAYYDSSFRPATTGISGFIAKAGVYSYSIYLLHIFVVFRVAKFVHTHVLSLSNFYVAFAASLACYGLMMGVGWGSYRFIEAPFLRYRKRYTLPGDRGGVQQV